MSLAKKAARNDTADVWEQAWKKLVVYIREASGLVADLGDGKAAKAKDLYVKVISQKDSSVAQSRVLKKCANGAGTWNQFFVLDISEENPTISVEVWAKGRFKDTFLGRAVLVEKPLGLTPEEVYEAELNLQPTKPKDKVSKDARMQVRFLFSDQHETLADGNPNLRNRFDYDAHLREFKSGDLIAYSGIGLVASLAKLESNSCFSNLGIVVKLPNKYTDRNELYLLEVTRNLDSLFDPFSDSPRNGVCLFRLFERIHQVHAHKVYWIPRVKEMPNEKKERFVDWVFCAHAKATIFDNVGFYAESPAQQILTYITHQFKIAKNWQRVTELYAIRILREAFSILQSDPDFDPVDRVSDIVALPTYSAPVLIREPKPSDPAAVSAQPAFGTSASGVPRRAYSSHLDFFHWQQITKRTPQLLVSQPTTAGGALPTAQALKPAAAKPAAAATTAAASVAEKHAEKVDEPATAVVAATVVVGDSAKEAEEKGEGKQKEADDADKDADEDDAQEEDVNPLSVSQDHHAAVAAAGAAVAAQQRTHRLGVPVLPGLPATGEGKLASRGGDDVEISPRLSSPTRDRPLSPGRRPTNPHSRSPRGGPPERTPPTKSDK
eukprot:CAMPEP_0177645366 /NCGR_PEP_ID=MMETSP0447-20121125/9209_1 /TAXON_ID=0 /ORGANISM="Stygamoeba regulata, Strain BSH-02190019" /LENGTH=607 /DNA_ID=CAMNT_0019147841 /DNA_START=52 /DNA_END=1875 /DNA_ORIENTATION=+